MGKTLKETKPHTCKIELQGLPNLIGRNDEKFMKQLQHAQWCGCHLQQKKTNKMRKGQSSYERCKNKLRQKENHPKNPLMGANGRLNNKKVA